MYGWVGDRVWVGERQGVGCVLVGARVGVRVCLCEQKEGGGVTSL